MTARSGAAPRRPTAPATVTVLLVLALTFLDTTVVAVVLGNIQYRLGAGVIPLQWVLDGYALPFAALMLVTGSFGDRYGRRRLLLAGVLVLGAGALICALAAGVTQVIAGRAVMGIGAAAAEPGTLALLRRIHPDPAARARALGAWAAVSGLSLALGPLAGGLLLAVGGWRAVFWANVVAAWGLALAVLRFVPESSDASAARPDLAGAALGAGGLAAGITAILAGEQVGLRWPVVLAGAAGIAALGCFVAVERRVRAPVVDLRLTARPAIWRALLVAFGIWFGVFSIFFLTVLYLDIAEAWTGSRLAAAFAPMALAIVAGAIVSGRVVARAGPRWPMTVGCALAAAAVAGTRAVITPDPSFAVVTAVIAVAGLGFGVAVVPLTAVVLGQAPPQHSGMAASITTTARQLGAVTGVAVLGAVVNGYLSSGLGGDLRARGFSAAVLDGILHLLETGGAGAAGIDFAHPDPLTADIVDAAVAAFRQGVHAGLLVAAALIALAGLFAVAAPRGAYRPPPDRKPEAEPRDGQPIAANGTSDGSAPPSTANTASA